MSYLLHSTHEAQKCRKIKCLSKNKKGKLIRRRGQWWWKKKLIRFGRVSKLYPVGMKLLRWRCGMEKNYFYNVLIEGIEQQVPTRIKYPQNIHAHLQIFSIQIWGELKIENKPSKHDLFDTYKSVVLLILFYTDFLLSISLCHLIINLKTAQQ